MSNVSLFQVGLSGLKIKFVNVLVSSPCETEPRDKHVYYIVFYVVIVVSKTPARRSLITVDLA